MIGLAAIEFASARDLPVGGVFVHLQRYQSFLGDPEMALAEGLGAGIFPQGQKPDARRLAVLKGRTIHLDATGAPAAYWGAWVEALEAVGVGRLFVTFDRDVITWQAK